MSNKIANGNKNVLNEDQERMRLEVIDLELKARYWRAQYEIRSYTLAAEEIQPKYDEYLAAQKAKREEMEKAFFEQLEKIQKQTQEQPHDLVEEANGKDSITIGAANFVAEKE
jgi:hypothetical protein